MMRLSARLFCIAALGSLACASASAQTLFNKYKNARATATILSEMNTDLNNVLLGLMSPSSGILLGYGDAAVLRDPTNPRRIVVTYKINPALTIREILVRYSLDLTLGV